MAKKNQNKKQRDDQYQKQVRRNQIIFGFVAVLLILSMGLSMVTSF